MRATVYVRDGHDNGWTALRALMAAAVMVGHAMIIANRDLAAEPMVYGSYSISYMAVNAFFVASGFLVTASMMHRGRLLDFVVARGLRIYPALIVHVLVVMLVVGVANTTLPLGAYLAHPEVWLQLPRVLLFIDTDFLLPGVFAGNHEAYASAPLWTLRFELLAYAGTAIAFALGLMRSRGWIAAQFGAFVILWLVARGTGLFDEVPGSVQNVLRFGLPYGLGALIWAYRDELPFRAWVVPFVWIAAVVSAGSILGEVVMNMAVAYSLFWMAYGGSKLFDRWAKGADISYGLYIWHWPILQWIAAQTSGLGSVEMIAIAAPLTVVAAWVSWHVVEKPMLAKKGALAAWVRTKRRKSVLVAE